MASNDKIRNEKIIKWFELDAFFKRNSKYYKKIDNSDIVFFIYPCGAGGNFLVNLFLDEADIPVRPNNTYSATDKVKNLRGYNDVTNYRFLKYLNINDINNIEATDEIFKNTFTDLKDTSYIVSHM